MLKRSNYTFPFKVYRPVDGCGKNHKKRKIYIFDLKKAVENSLYKSILFRDMTDKIAENAKKQNNMT